MAVHVDKFLILGLILYNNTIFLYMISISKFEKFGLKIAIVIPFKDCVTAILLN